MRFTLYLLTALLITLVGCQDEQQGNGQPTETVDESFIQSHNTFGFNLLQNIAENETDNIFISPTSILVALSMLYNGADGMTQDEIAETLQLDGIDVATLNDANSALLSILDRETEDITLKIANSLWINDDFEFQEQFAKHMEEYYDATIEAIDIYDPNSPKLLNDWVSDATNKKIDEIVESIPSSLVAYIINAIYLDAGWTIPFDETLTEDKPFYLANGDVVNVPLMMLRDNFNYLENDDFQAIQLTYGDDSEMNMTIILPTEDSSADELVQSMSKDDWNKWQTQFNEQEGTILLPKFTLEYDITLNDTLIALGMPSAFNEQADLTKLVKDSNDLYVSEVKHKSFIDVNEEGTEAAAATSIAIMEMSATDQDEPFYMEVNRPFIISITDNETEAILFIGAIKDPS